ncbi:MAG: phenylacetate--CoA ligase family protein [candidate division Zixibacteria bacterium]|jgi:phenylacetate-CoA ligase|nr:phenylacetate--CoA ligase family protein [candidate division Zixibacteria bacterium]
MKFVREAERTQWLPPEQLQQLQLTRLKALLSHAAKNCPFYARRFAEAGFDPVAVQSLRDIERLPVLTKSDIQQHRDELTAASLPISDRIPNQTGGSTGSPLRFFMSPDSVYRRIANTIRHDRWAGLEPYHKGAAIWGHRRDLNAPRSTMDNLRDRFFSRRVILDTSEITEEKLARFVERLNKEKPSTYVAYANAIYLIARFIKERGITGYHRPKSIITSAEVLTDDQRRLLEDVFGCPVFNRYGSREFSVIASECEAHRGLHIAADTLLVEIIRNDRACRPGELGQIVITDLHNYALPFIRYRIEDMGMLLETGCSCGRTLPMMEIVGGRVTDFLVTPEGAVVSGAAMTIYFIARVPGIVQAQLVQKKKDFLLLRLAVDQSFGEDSKRMIAESVNRFFGPLMKYEIEQVDSIPVEASGKYRFSISEIDPVAHLK